MYLNQRGEEVKEQVLDVFDNIDRAQLNEVVFALLDHLKLRAVRTNNTKHGDWQTAIQIL